MTKNKALIKLQSDLIPRLGAAEHNVLSPHFSKDLSDGMTKSIGIVVKKNLGKTLEELGFEKVLISHPTLPVIIFCKQGFFGDCVIKLAAREGEKKELEKEKVFLKQNQEGPFEEVLAQGEGYLVLSREPSKLTAKEASIAEWRAGLAEVFGHALGFAFSSKTKSGGSKKDPFFELSERLLEDIDEREPWRLCRSILLDQFSKLEAIEKKYEITSGTVIQLDLFSDVVFGPKDASDPRDCSVKLLNVNSYSNDNPSYMLYEIALQSNILFDQLAFENFIKAFGGSSGLKKCFEIFSDLDARACLSRISFAWNFMMGILTLDSRFFHNCLQIFEFEPFVQNNEDICKSLDFLVNFLQD